MAAVAAVAAAGGHFTPRAPAERSAPRMRRRAPGPAGAAPWWPFQGSRAAHPVRGSAGLGCAGLCWAVLGNSGLC